MINRVTLTGRLTRNVDLRYTPSGVAVGNFTLAVDRQFTNRNGQRGTDFIRCVIWRKSAENFANFTHKGSLVGIDGRIQTGSYQNQQGQTVYTTDVVVDNFALLESKQQSQASGQPNGPANKVTNNNAPQNGGQNGPMNPFASQGNNNQNSGYRPKYKPNNGGNAPAGGPKKPFNPNKPKGNGNGGNNKDPFANSGNKKIDISDDDLPF